MTPELARWQSVLEAAVRQAGDDDPAHDLGHFRRVWQMARYLAAAEAPDADPLVLLAASYLHDLVNIPKDSPERRNASRRSAKAAVELLRRLGFPEHKLDAVAHVIEAHSYAAGIEPRTLEARILQDADRLDALGATGLARMFAIGGRMGRPIADPDDPFAAERAPDDVRFTLDHVRVKLERLPGMMHTRTAREIAQRRLAFVRLFLGELASELAPPSRTVRWPGGRA